MRILLSATFLVASQLTAASAQTVCGNVIPPTNVTKVCLESTDPCTYNNTGCCPGLICTGFTFFKSCKVPPACLEEWHDCSSNPNCCGSLVCGQGTQGTWECRPNEIGLPTTTVPIPPGGLVKGTASPTAAPTMAKNTKTTVIPGQKVNKTDIATATGDPHIYTFDGFKFDCQGEGEHILLTSRITQRQVQTHQMHYSNNTAIAVIRGVAIQDEGDTPLVELSIPLYNDTVANDFGLPGCRIMLFVDGVQKDINVYNGTSKVSITASGSVITVFYPASGFKVTAGMSQWHICLLNLNVFVPRTDPTIHGILGTPNDNITDEWTMPNGTIVPIPPGIKSAISQNGYGFCVPNYCITNASMSLFGHQEPGDTFDMRNRCLLPFGATWEQYLGKVPQDILDICGDDLACIMDGMNAGETAARDFRNTRLALLGTCSNINGSCDVKQCCPGLNCINLGYGGMTCGSTPACTQELGDCRDIHCCGILSCQQQTDGRFMCVNPACRPEWESCSTSNDCCKGLTCVNNNKGGMQCRNLPSCMAAYEDCTQVGCCPGGTCIAIPGGHWCDITPACWSLPNTDCSKAPCCPGLGMACVQGNGRSLCTKVPACVGEGLVCTYSPCCQTSAKPLQCVNYTDTRGNSATTCRLLPSNVRIQVFDDTNANGQYDVGEPGVPNVQARLVYAKDGSFVANQNNGGNAHQVLRSDATGLILFTQVPLGSLLRAQFTLGPPGGVVTDAHKAGVPAGVDSDLLSDGMTDPFVLNGTGLDFNQTVGYIMPSDVKITVWSDDNGNGIYDAGESGVAGVQLRLVTNADQRYIVDPKNGGSSAAVLNTDANGTATFTKVTERVQLAVLVTKAPVGAVPTIYNAGTNQSTNSDLLASGQYSGPFTLTKGSSYLEDTIKLGYLLPQTAVVRVWDDANANGIQDAGELGIPSVKLRLIFDSNLTNLPNYNNGGTAASELVTDSNGMVQFTKVPGGVKLRVKVDLPPPGAIPTFPKVGSDPTLDSDLIGNSTTDAFMMSSATYSSTDIGYRMPENVLIRIWDDANMNGLQDAGEVGIPNVALKLILASDGTNLPCQNNGGNAHQQLTSASDGTVTFSKVPQGIALRAFVANAPKGAIVTLQDVGTNASIDSNLGPDLKSDVFTLTGQGPPTFSDISLGFQMPMNLTVKVWDDVNGNGIQDAGELGVKNVGLRLILDKDLTFLPNPGNGGNAANVLTTDVNGLAIFTLVPKGIMLRVKVTNPPPGAVRTTVATASAAGACGTATKQTYGSVSQGIGFYSGLPIEVTQQTETSVSFKVNQNWNPGSSVGWILVDYPIAGSRSCQLSSNVATSTDVYTAVCGSGYTASVNVYVYDSTFTTAPNTVDGNIPSYCNPPSNVGNKTAFSFNIACACPETVAMPDGTTQVVSDGSDSDLLDDGTTTPFDLGDFSGDIYSGIALGYLMPSNITVRVWDDVNGDGLQTVGEPGVTGVQLKLIIAANGTQCPAAGTGSTANTVQKTDVNGYANFTLVPKGVDLRVQVINKPPGAITTSENTGLEAGLSSDLRPDGTSEMFNLNAFIGKSVDDIDLGYRMPANMTVRVWEDINNNGLMDAGEPGIKSVGLRLITDSNKQNLQPIGASGSTAANLVYTDVNGVANFTLVPKGIDLRVIVTNAPAGSIPTILGGDSDYTTLGYSTVFNLGSFDTSGAFTGINLGFHMPKNVAVRVWNDANVNGIMESTEAGFKSVYLRLIVPSTGANFPDPGTGGNAGTEIATDATGRALFTLVPQGIPLQLKITRGLPAGSNPTVKNAGTDPTVNSNANANGTSDTFTIPPDTTSLYALTNFGYQFVTKIVSTRSVNLKGCDTTADLLTGTVSDGSGMYHAMPIVIGDQTDQTVKFQVSQTWITGGQVAYIAANYDGLTGNACDTANGVTDTTPEYTAVCSADSTGKMTAEIDVWVYDTTFTPPEDISDDFAATGCASPTVTGGQFVRFTFDLPCCGA